MVLFVRHKSIFFSAVIFWESQVPPKTTLTTISVVLEFGEHHLRGTSAHLGFSSKRNSEKDKNLIPKYKSVILSLTVKL